MDSNKSFNFIESLPIDLKKYIGKIVWREHIKTIHNELKNTYKIGMSSLEIRNGRKRKIFVYTDFGNDVYNSNCAFYELSTDVNYISELKGWERTPYNFRQISPLFSMTPGTMCIKNHDRNVSVLPARYTYSRKMDRVLYNKYTRKVSDFRERFEYTKTIRPETIYRL